MEPPLAVLLVLVAGLQPAAGATCRPNIVSATVFTKADGTFRFESPFPSDTAHSRTHVRVSGPGFADVDATCFTRAGTPRARLPLVLAPAR
jgi:hypothetical protein